MCSSKRIRLSINANQNDDNEDNQHKVDDFSLSHAGVIKSITLVNFMCHDHLEFQLGRCLNFITGKNGSGKSALLSGLVIALGASSSRMNRGNVLKSYIKSGKQYAEVSVVLNNEGPAAYKPDLFGDSVTINRRITPNGSNYRVMMSTGKIFSTKKEDVLEILSDFRIMIDNPVVVLTQDDSKRFLSVMDNKKLFQFYFKASLLEKLCSDVDEIEGYLDETKSILSLKKKDLKVAEKEVNMWRKKCDEFRAVDEVKKTIDSLKAMLNWVHVEFLEKQIQQAEESIAAKEKSRQEFETSRLTLNTELESTNLEVDELATDINKQAADCEPLVVKLREKKAEVDAQKTLFVKAQFQKTNKLKEKAKNENQRSQYITEIADLKAANDKANDTDVVQLEANVQELKEKYAGLEASKQVLFQDIGQYDETVEEIKMEMDRVNHEIQYKRQSIRQVQTNLTALTSSSSDMEQRYGPGIVELRRRIKQSARLFSKPPLGPLGLYVKLKHDKFANAAEAALKPKMGSFVVNNFADQKIIQKLIDETFRFARDRNIQFFKPEVIVDKFQTKPHDVSRFRPRMDAMTILEALEFEGEEGTIVRNVLIDQRSIECIGMFQNSDEMQQTLLHMKIPNLREAFEYEDGTQAKADPYRYYLTPFRSTGRLTANVDDVIRRNEEDIASRKQELKLLESQLRELEERSQHTRMNRNKCSDDQRKTEKQMQELNNKIRKLNRELEEANSKSSDSEIMELENMVADLSNSVEKLETEIESLQDVEKAEKEKLKELEEKTAAMTEIYKKARLKMAKAKERFDALAKAKNDFAKQIAKYDHNIRQCDAGIKKYQEFRETTEQQLQDDFLSRLGERVPTNGKTKEFLDKEIQILTEQVETRIQAVGDPEHSANRYKTTNAQYNEMNDTWKLLKDIWRVLIKEKDIRKKYHDKLGKHCEYRLKLWFTQHLKNVGFDGTVDVDYERSELVIRVQKQGKSALTDLNTIPVTNLRSFSGGERSCITVCFLLALWSIVETPFRCLDEFDVFMDMANRKLTLSQISHFAQSTMAKKGQFIMLTPQDLNILKAENLDQSLIRRFRLDDPRTI